MNTLHYLILLEEGREIVSFSFVEGDYFLDDIDPQFGPFYVLETAMTRPDGSLCD